jgi:DNA-binding CsgD family transcriptional regulator
MLRVLNTDTEAGESVSRRPDQESKLDKALRLLQECGFKAIFMDMNTVHNGVGKTTVICQHAGRRALAVDGRMGIPLPTRKQQQTQVLKSLGEAKPNKRIAFELGITATTVKAHVTNIYRKLGVRNRSEAMLLLQALRTSCEPPIPIRFQTGV